VSELAAWRRARHRSSSNPSGALFGNPLLASAAMDRLLHHAHVLGIEGDPYRNPPPARKRKAQPAAEAAR